MPSQYESDQIYGSYQSDNPITADDVYVHPGETTVWLWIERWETHVTKTAPDDRLQRAVEVGRKIREEAGRFADEAEAILQQRRQAEEAERVAAYDSGEEPSSEPDSPGEVSGDGSEPSHVAAPSLGLLVATDRDAETRPLDAFDGSLPPEQEEAADRFEKAYREESGEEVTQ